MEGQRLARHRDQQQARGASQPAARGQEEKTCTRREFQVLQDWDNGKLREDLSKAIVALGHGRLTTASGDYLDIGGSTGGWVPAHHRWMEAAGLERLPRGRAVRPHLVACVSECVELLSLRARGVSYPVCSLDARTMYHAVKTAARSLTNVRGR